MSERVDNRKAASVSEEAAEWFVCLRDDELGARERGKYVRWLKQSPAHVEEMLRISELAGWLHDIEGPVSTYDPASNVVEFPPVRSD